MPFLQEALTGEDSNDVIAEVYPHNNKTEASKQILSRRTGKRPKTVLTTFVKENEINREATEEPQKQEPHKQTEKSQHCPCLASTSSSYIQPMIQIQNALENKIASLVDTLRIADSAEKEYIYGKHCCCPRTNPCRNELPKSLHDEQPITKQQRPDKSNEKLSKPRPAASVNNKIELKGKTSSFCKHPNNITPKKSTFDSKKRNTKLQSSRRPITAHHGLLQTPIARRKPPKPHSYDSNKNPVVSATPPRMSKKGCALLHQILGDQESFKIEPKESSWNILKTGATLSAEMVDENTTASPERVDDNANIINFQPKETPKSKALPVEMDSLVRRTTKLKTNLQETNRDVDQFLESDHQVEQIPNVPAAKESDFILKEFSQNEEFPIDKYLIYAHNTKFFKKKTEIIEEPGNEDIASEVANVLLKAQIQRRILDENLDQVLRKTDHFEVFSNPSNDERQTNTLRIKKEINAKILEIEKENQMEMKRTVKENDSNKQPDNLKQNKKLSERTTGTNIKKVTTALHKQHLQHQHSQKTSPQKFEAKSIKARRKNKETVPPPVSSTAYDELISKHFGGKQLPTGSTEEQTIKKFTPNSRRTGEENEARYKQTRGHDNNSNTLFFHPHHSLTNVALPLSGNLFPVATLLAEPNMDPSMRLPICQDSPTHNISRPTLVQRDDLKVKNNVAVVSIKHDETDESQTSIKDSIKARVRKRVKEKLKLKRQILPNLDIDTSESSTSFVSTNQEASQRQSDKEKTVNEQVNSFEDFVAVQDFEGKRRNDASQEAVIENNDDDNDDDEGMEDIVQLPVAVLRGERPSQMHEETVAQQDFLAMQTNMTKPHVEASTFDMLERIAYEWVEQNLLSRIVAQLNTQDDQPTEQEFAANAHLYDLSDHYEQNEENGGWIDNVIGLQGIQLFVDAGIPVDGQLIAELTHSVIVEKLDSMFGFPVSRESESISKQPGTPSALHHQKRNEEKIQGVVPTPPHTPPPCEHANTTSNNTIQTPLQSTISDLQEQSLHDIQVIPSPVADIVPREHVATPLVSETDDNERASECVVTPQNSSLIRSSEIVVKEENVITPDVTTVDTGDAVSLIEQKDISITSSEGDKKTITPIVSLPRVSSPSTPSTGLPTYSSSTAVGLSTFEGISDGEHLLPEEVLSDYNYSEGDITPVVLAMQTVEKISKQLNTNLQSDNITAVTSLRRQESRPDIVDKLAGPRSEGEVLCAFYPGQQNGVDDGERTSVDDDTFSVSYDQPLSTNNKDTIQSRQIVVAPAASRRRKSPYEFSEGEYLSEANDTSFSTTHNTADMLTIGQLVSNEHSSSRDVKEDVPARVITVRLIDATANRQFPPADINLDTSGRQFPPADTDTFASDSKSEGEVMRSELLDDVVSVADGNNMEGAKKTMVVLNLPTAGNETSILTDDGSVSEYDISTLSGGEL